MEHFISKCLFVCCFLLMSLPGFSQKSAELVMFESSNGALGLGLYGMSPNGKWAVLYAGSQGAYNNPTLWNLENYGTTVLLGQDDNENTQAQANAVDNSGMAVGAYDDIPAYFKDGSWIQLPLPDGYDGGEVKAVSADGSIMIGSATIKENFVNVKACKWVNGQLVDVVVPEKDSRNEKVDTCPLFGISADGNTMWGFLNFTYIESCTPAIWNPEPQIICEDIYYNESGERNYTSIYNNVAMSWNGKYMVGYVDYDKGPNNTDAGFLYTVETKKTTVYEENSETGEVTTSGMAVDNNGVIYEGKVISGPIREAYIRVEGKQYKMADYLKNEYNFDLSTVEAIQDLGTVMGVSEDGKTVVGWEGPGTNWCLKLSDAPGVATAIQTTAADQISVLVDGKSLVVKGKAESVRIVDLAGNVVISQSFDGSAVNLAGLPLGVYVAKVVANGQNVVKKIVVR